MSKHAVALRRYRIGDTLVAKDEIVRDMADDQFADFEMAGLVREAPAQELAPPATKHPARARKPRTKRSKPVA